MAHKKKTSSNNLVPKRIRGRTQNQRSYLQSIRENTVTFCTGLAGTGKTFLALYEGMKLVADEDQPHDRIIIVRPYMASNIGEDLGALPGDVAEKVSPYTESIKDNLRQMINPKDIDLLFARGIVQFMILRMCRGRSFNNCVVIIEEAQNVPIDGEAFKMLLTRIGENCKMIVSGDIDQCDIDPDRSGLQQAIELLYGLDSVGIVHMGEPKDVQRNALIRGILERYNGSKNNTGVRSLQTGSRGHAQDHDQEAGEENW